VIGREALTFEDETHPETRITIIKNRKETALDERNFMILL
jgi:hypothetical protein